jgi:hypothetical protein
MAYEVASKEIGISRKFGVSQTFSLFFCGVFGWFISGYLFLGVNSAIQAIPWAFKVKSSQDAIVRNSQRLGPRV